MAQRVNGKITDMTRQAEQMALPWTQPSPLPPERPAEETGLFGPGRPILPAEPEEAPRVFEYQPGINLVSIPRSGYGLASFNILRNLAATCKEIRLNIELIKREIRALEFTIEGDNENQARQMRELFEQPDGYHDFDSWLNMLLEEMLVIDAVTIWPEMTLDGQVQALELVDGSTIRPLLDFRGRIAPPPAPAFVQMLHGTPTAAFSRDRLIYRPFNTSTSSPYGASPIEFVLLAVNLALRRDTYHISYFTEGNVPEALVGAPASWTQDQVDTWQGYWDALVAGNVTEQRKIHFIPVEGGRGSIPVYEFRRDDINQTEQDKWLMQVACWAFGNSPAEFGLTPGAGLGGKGYAEGQENIHYRSMILPITQYLERMFTGIIRNRFGIDGRFKWLGLEPQEDKLQQAQIDQIYIQAGVYGPDYVRNRLGIEDSAAGEVGAEKFFRGYP